MRCPSCTHDMTALDLMSSVNAPMVIDMCATCQAFWFDRYESFQLSAASTLKVMKLIGENTTSSKPQFPAALRCTRCQARLSLTHDRQLNMPFVYFRCPDEHGHFISFFEFLKEKKYVRPITPEQLKQLKANVQTLNCSSCGAAIDLVKDSACSFCHSPISMLDMSHPQEMLAQLKKAAELKTADPANLKMKLMFAKIESETAFKPFEKDAEWWQDAHSGDLVQAGLNTVGRWLVDLID